MQSRKKVFAIILFIIKLVIRYYKEVKIAQLIYNYKASIIKKVAQYIYFKILLFIDFLMPVKGYDNKFTYFSPIS